MKVLLAYHGGQTARREYHAGLLPLGLGYLAATLRRAGIPVALANLTRSSASQVRELLARERPDVLGLSVFTHNRHESFRIAAAQKRLHPASHVVVGGPHANHLPEQILRHYPVVDSVALGEGEETLLELALALKERRALDGVAGLALRGGIAGLAPRGGVAGLDARGEDVRRTAPRAMQMELDRIPPPDFGPPAFEVDERAQRGYLLSSRGCPADCSFCDSPAFWGRRLRFHSPARIVADLTDLRDRLGLLAVSFRDDTFAIHRSRAIELLSAIRDARLGVMWDGQTRVNGVDAERLSLMSHAGCHHLQYGIESGSPRMLEILAKGVDLDQVRRACRMTREAGLLLSIYLISGVPGEGDAEARETEALVREILPHDGIVSPLAIYPGTPLHAELRAKGAFDDARFLTEPAPAILARDDRTAEALFYRYERALQGVARRARFTRADLERLRAEQGAHAPLLVRLADMAIAAADRGWAATLLDEASRAAPEDPWVPLLSARLALDEGRPKAAATHLRALRRLVPRSVDAERLEAEMAAPRSAGPRAAAASARGRGTHSTALL